MSSYSEMHGSTAEENRTCLDFDENILSDLIQGKIGKLRELESGVIKALDAAREAERLAKDAGKLSASFWSLSDQKKEAIEGLQKVSIELAQAVQLEAQAQKYSFDFQTRLAKISNYLFQLGVGNIANNRMVVRELEMRLRGASEEELSELARQELMSVIKQLKEQEDLLRKQEQIKEALHWHDNEIKHLLDQTDTQRGGLEVLTNELALARSYVEEATENVLAQIDDLGQKLKDQQDFQQRALTNQADTQQARLEVLTNELAVVRSHAEEATAKMRAQIDDLGQKLKDQQDFQQHALASMDNFTEQASKQLQQEMSDLRQIASVQHHELERLTVALAQAGSHTEQVNMGLRSVLDKRTAMLAIWATLVPATIYFFW